MSSKPYSPNGEVLDLSQFPKNIRRVALGVEYDGTHLHGFQAQSSGVPTVGQALEKALTAICDEKITVVCAGRTDAGVHATAQVVHFDTKAIRPERAWLLGANSRLPDSVSIRWAKEVSPLFHARFSAESRTYRYIVHNTKTPSAILRKKVTWWRHSLCEQKMREAASHLIGEHDFNAYRAAQCQASHGRRCITRIHIERQNDFVIVEISANAFLYHMVRNIMGVLLHIASGHAAPEWAKEVLDGKDRSLAAATAPAHGLYLVNIGYPQVMEIPCLDPGPYFVCPF